MSVLRVLGLRWLPVAVMLVAGSGCYAYAVVPAETVEPGDRVRVTMTPAEVMRQAELLETLDQTLEGRVLGKDPAQGLSLNFQDPDAAAGGPDFRRVITLPWETLVQVEGSQVSWLQTGLTIAAGVVVAVAIISATTGGTSDDNQGETPPIDEDRSMPRPLFRIPMPFFPFGPGG